MSNLLFGVTVPPYRVDFYNHLHNKYDCEFYFMNKEVDTQKFDMQSIFAKCDFQINFLERGIVFYKNLRNILLEANPQVVFVSEFSLISLHVILLRFVLKLRFKVVVMCDDSYNMLTETGDLSTKHSISRNIVMSLADNIVNADRKASEWYKEKYNKGIWFPIIYNESLNRYFANLIPKSNLLINEHLLQGRHVILYVGRLVAIKNISALLNTMKEVNKKSTLVIIGSGNQMDVLMRQAKELDADIRFLGRKEGDELFAWYNVADIFILPSIVEPFGAVTSEALISGCYSLVSSKAGSSSLIVEGKNGNIIDPENIVDISSKINSRLNVVSIHKGDIKERESLLLIDFEKMMSDMWLKIIN